MATNKSVARTEAASPPATIAGKPSLMMRMAQRYGVDADKFNATLKATAFKVKGGEVSNEQMLALMVIADQYQLNPFTKEIYAFPSDGGIVPIIGVDGWIRMINTHPQFAWMELTYAEDEDDNPWIQCTIQRKDRDRPTVIREYMDECKRNTGPWNSHPRRMLRHKAIIQCGRVAFGFGGVYDPDEGDRIVSVQEVPSGKPLTQAPRAKSDPPPPPAESITADQAIVLRDKCDAEGVELTLLCAKFEIGVIEDLPASAHAEAYAWIDSASASE